MLRRYKKRIAVYYDVKKHKYTFCLQNTENFNVETDNTYGKYCTVLYLEGEKYRAQH